VAGGSTANNAAVVQYTCTGATNQYWYWLYGIENLNATNADGVSMVLGIPGASQAKNVQVVLTKSLAGHNDQTWSFY
jgi:hypothetical protein